MQGTEMLNLIFAWHRKAFKFEALKVSIPGMFFRQNRQIAPFFAVVISLVLFFTACSPVRKLKENERLIVKHEDKPSAEVIAKIKKRGFKFSPKTKSWVRQFTHNAVTSARILVEELRDV